MIGQHDAGGVRINRRSGPPRGDMTAARAFLARLEPGSGARALLARSHCAGEDLAACPGRASEAIPRQEGLSR